MKHTRRGFTLVELIVTLTVLSIAAAVTVPSLTGYMDRTREQKVLAEARTCVAAAESLAAEQLAAGTLKDWDALWDGSSLETGMEGFRSAGDGYYVKTGSTAARSEAGPGSCAQVQAAAGVPGTVSQVACNGDAALVRLTYGNEGYTVVYLRGMVYTPVPEPVPTPEPAPTPAPAPGGGSAEGGSGGGSGGGGSGGGGTSGEPVKPVPPPSGMMVFRVVTEDDRPVANCEFEIAVNGAATVYREKTDENGYLALTDEQLAAGWSGHFRQISTAAGLQKTGYTNFTISRGESGDYQVNLNGSNYGDITAAGNLVTAVNPPLKTFSVRTQAADGSALPYMGLRFAGGGLTLDYTTGADGTVQIPYEYVDSWADVERDCVHWAQIQRGMQFTVSGGAAQEQYVPLPAMSFYIDWNAFKPVFSIGYTQDYETSAVWNEEEQRLTISYQKRIPVYKMDKNGTALDGAELVVINEWGSWATEKMSTSAGTCYLSLKNSMDQGLALGQQYRLRELTAPAGYQKAQDISFKLEWNAQRRQVEVVLTDGGASPEIRTDSLVMYDMPQHDDYGSGALLIYKRDENGNHVSGAQLTITPADDHKKGGGGTWETGKGTVSVMPVKKNNTAAGEICLSSDTSNPYRYILHESVTPPGYTGSADIEFYVTETRGSGSDGKLELSWRYAGEDQWRTDTTLRLSVINKKMTT